MTDTAQTAVDIDNYIQPADEINVLYRSTALEGFKGRVIEIGDGEPGTRELVIVREGNSLLCDGAFGVREDHAVFSVRRGDTWVSVPPQLPRAEAETKSVRNAINTKKRIERDLPLFAPQIDVQPTPAQEWIDRTRSSAIEMLQREHDTALEATALREQVQERVTPEDFTLLVEKRERWSTGGSYGVYFWKKQLAHILTTGQPDIFQPPPILTAKLSLPWLIHDAHLTWIGAPGGPQKVRVLFIGSDSALVRLVGEPMRDYDPRLIPTPTVWVKPEDFLEGANTR